MGGEKTIPNANPKKIGSCAFGSIAQLVLMDDFWVYLFAMARSLYAPMRALRLADQKTPSMGLLEYFVRQADRIIPKYLKAGS